MRSALAALSLLGCARAPTIAPPARPVAEVPALPWPVDESALRSASPATRAVALVDLFDAARLLGDAPSRALLFGALGLEGFPRGEEATRQALEALARATEEARLTDLAALLDDDLDELEGNGALAPAAHRKRLRADPVAGGHALLALYASCARPLVDASSAPPWRRAAIANHCLYPLHDADPAPYFRADAAARPPDPPWGRYLDGLRALLDEARRRAPRLAPLCDRLTDEVARFAEAVDRDGLAPPDVSRLAATLPEGDDALPPYDREPWVIVEGEMAVVGRAKFGPRDHLLVERIERVLSVQRLSGQHGRVALFVPAAGSAEVIDSLSTLARRGGAETIALVLSAPLALRAPPGDVWAEGAPSRRFVVLPLQLRAPLGRDLPREIEARPPALTMLVAPEGLIAFAGDGAVELGPLAGAPARLAELRRAFPDETQIALAIDPTATYRDLIAVARAARATFRRLSLVPVPRRQPGPKLATRLLRRAAARFAPRTADAVLGARAEALRGCYLDALERDPELTATVRITATPLRVDGAGDDGLRECLARRASALGAKVDLTIDLAPR